MDLTSLSLSLSFVYSSYRRSLVLYLTTFGNISETENKSYWTY